MNPTKIPTTQLSRHSAIVSQQYHVLHLLLEHGADPNMRYSSHATIWEEFLTTVYNNGQQRSRAHKKIFFEIMKSLILHGADLEARPIVKDFGSHAIHASLTQVIRKAFLEAEQQRLLTIIKSPRDRRCSALLSVFSYTIVRPVRLLRELCTTSWKWWQGTPRIIVDEVDPGIEGLYGSHRSS